MSSSRPADAAAQQAFAALGRGNVSRSHALFKSWDFQYMQLISLQCGKRF